MFTRPPRALLARFAFTLLVLPAAFASVTASASTASASSLSARGRQVALAADCLSCHSAPGGQPYAGGAALKTAFGNIYGPNITPDMKTGIGGWTRPQFVRAVREGVGRNGALLYPAMPYQNYTRMTDADVDALWAYLRSVPAVSHTVASNSFPFPLNVRGGLALWQSLYFHPGRFLPDGSHDATWNRGAYLVQALGHCDGCHAARNIAQATEPQHGLTGGQAEGWYAPDISNRPLSALSAWSTEELARFLKTGQGPGNIKAFGLMQQVIDESLRHLSDGDLRSMAVYLKDQPQPIPPPDVARSSVGESPTGKALYEDRCSSCHQSDGSGMQDVVPALAGNSAVTAREPYNLIMAMLEGFEPQGTWGAMASFARTLSDAQIADVANYVRGAWGNSAPPNATAWSVGNWRALAATPRGEPEALICPTLSPAILQPALSDPAALQRAAADHESLVSLVHSYRAARPQTGTAQVIEALSAAYCRTVVSARVSRARSIAQIAEFSQQVAAVLTSSEAPAAPH